ncbi:MAG: putative lipid II flippase FtsW [Fidelibacterota bacterium]
MIREDKKTDKLLIIVVFALVGLGTVLLYSASSIVAEEKFGSSTFFLKRHLIRLLIGTFFFLVAMNLNYRVYRKLSTPFMVIAFLLLLMTLVLNWRENPHSPARWLLGGRSLQTSEIAKFALIMYTAAFLERKQRQLHKFTDGFLPPVLVLAFTVFLIVLQPDFSTGALISIIIFILLFVGRARISHLLSVASITLFLMTLTVLNSSYRLNRIRIFLNPSSDASGMGYQIKQSLISLGTGGFWGVGLGKSIEKNLFLPEPHTDFILSIIGEEIGFLGIAVILTLLLILVIKGIKIANSAPDLFGFLLAVGITMSIFMYGIINAGVVSGLLPTTGLPFPFISYGGSILIMSLAGVGILVNISRSAVKKGNRIFKI